MRFLSYQPFLSSLPQLRARVHPSQVPASVLLEACQANPWYTPLYIRYALDAISCWMEEGALAEWLEGYPEPEPGRPLPRVGVITAGNVPFVGFHDVLAAIMAGCEVQARFSRQDRVLMRWLMGEWAAVCPELTTRFRETETLGPLDFLIATGSDNTGRQLRHRYRGIPSLVRGNRFSIALISDSLSEAEAAGLCRDILLYNGLGCRSVSSLLVEGDKLPEVLLHSLKSYPLSDLNPLYLEALAHQRAVLELLGLPYVDAGAALCVDRPRPGPEKMGLLTCVYASSPLHRDALLKSLDAQVQCRPGLDVPFGQAHRPGLADYADGADTIALLRGLSQAR